MTDGFALLLGGQRVLFVELLHLQFNILAECEVRILTIILMYKIAYMRHI